MINVMLDEGAYLPEKAFPDDAGFDLRTPVPITLAAYSPMCGPGKAFVDTGVHIDLPKGYAGMLKSKSGLNIKHDIIGEGVIDVGYASSIKVKLYNLGTEEYHFDRGDKIIQLVLTRISDEVTEDLVLVDKFEETARGFGGLGSTGK